jgi:hypothetical protein
MSINSVAFWSSDYAPAILSAKKTSFYAQNYQDAEYKDESKTEEEFLGIKPRKDEYIPSMQNKNREEERRMKVLGEKSREPNEETDVEKTDAEKADTEKTEKKEEFSEEEQKMISRLKSRDQEVRNHEQAHIAAGGAYVRGGASYSYQGGPDGKQYAIGGEVSIDTSTVKGNPSATIAKMQAVRAAALAPASPSGQDRAVAAAASQIEAQARIDLSEKISEENGTQKPEEKNAEKTKETDTAQKAENTENVGASEKVEKNDNIGVAQKTEKTDTTQKSNNASDQIANRQNPSKQAISAIFAYKDFYDKQANTPKIDFAA